MTFYPSILLVSIFLLSDAIPLKAEDASFQLDQQVHLIITQQNWPMALTAQIGIPASREIVWKVLTDYDHLSDFLPQMESSHVIQRDETKILVEQVSRAHFLFLRKKIKVKLSILENKNEEISFGNIGGNMELFSGKWILKELGDGKSTHLTYLLNFKPAFYAPKWLIRRTLDREVANQLRLISEQAEKLRIK